MTDAAFDAVASQYDDVAESTLGLILRDRVHEVLREHVRPGVSMLDLGCGTGLDAAWATGLGAKVTAVDASPQMVNRALRRLGDNASVRALDLNGVRWSSALPEFDLVMSNFGVVNCVVDLAAFGRELSAASRDGGTVVLVVMARIVPWELASSLRHMDRAGLQKRFGEGPRPSPEYPGIQVSYHTARSLVHGLGGDWRIRSARSLGWALPTYAQRGFADRHPKITSVLARIDRFCAPVAARLGLGDHQIVVLEAR